jgi:hypothetical protein
MLPSGARTKNLRTPRLCSQRMNNFEATPLRLLIRRLDVIANMSRDHRGGDSMARDWHHSEPLGR